MNAFMLLVRGLTPPFGKAQCKDSTNAWRLLPADPPLRTCSTHRSVSCLLILLPPPLLVPPSVVPAVLAWCFGVALLPAQPSVTAIGAAVKNTPLLVPPALCDATGCVAAALSPRWC